MLTEHLEESIEKSDGIVDKKSFVINSTIEATGIVICQWCDDAESQSIAHVKNNSRTTRLKFHSTRGMGILSPSFDLRSSRCLSLPEGIFPLLFGFHG